MFFFLSISIFVKRLLNAVCDEPINDSISFSLESTLYENPSWEAMTYGTHPSYSPSFIFVLILYVGFFFVIKKSKNRRIFFKLLFVSFSFELEYNSYLNGLEFNGYYIY